MLKGCSVMTTLGNINNTFAYTKLANNSRKTLDDFLDIFYSKEECEKLISRFETVNIDAKGDVERRIIKLLEKSSSVTGYDGTPGVTKCTAEDRFDDSKVYKAAEYYRSFARKLPDEETLKTKYLDEQFKVRMSEIVKNSHSSTDYITRLTKERMEVLSPELIHDGDSTRLLIFKQFLKASEFSSPSCMSASFKKRLCEITGLGEKPSEKDIDNAICSLTDNADGGPLNVFDLLGEARENEWTPLIWADDISRGFFNDQRTTRVKLYWYAIIFRMTFCFAGDEEAYNRDTDIQEKLFYGFYADNLLNNIIDSSPALLSQTEKEPSGHGINIKNFIEVIYLYYIHKNGLTPKEKLTKAKSMINRCKTSDATILTEQSRIHNSKDTWLYENILDTILKLDEEKLCNYIKENFICGRVGTNSIRAYEENTSAAQIHKIMITHLKNLCSQLYDLVPFSSENMYKYMENRYYLAERCAKCKHADPYIFYENCPEFGNNCRDDYDEYVKDCEKEEKNPRTKEAYYLTRCATCKTAIERAPYTLCPLFTDECSKLYTEYRKKLSPKKANDAEKEIREGFTKKAAYDYLHIITDLTNEIECFNDDQTVHNLLCKIADKIKVTERKTTTDGIIESSFGADNSTIGITRTKLISMYYYIFMIKCKIDNLSFDSFNDFYNEFCNNFCLQCKIRDNHYTFYGINSLLEEAGYQEINMKNIFDISIIFLAIKKIIKINIDRK